MRRLAWIVVALVLALAIGPLLWLLPSKRDKRIGELRAAARRAGLVVETTAVPKIDAAAEEQVSSGGAPRAARLDCAAYRLLLPKPLLGAPSWRLLKAERENRYLAGWTTLRPPRNVPTPSEDYWRRIGDLVDGLPGGCVGVDAGEGAVAWLGVERPTDASGETSSAEALIDEVRARLQAIADFHGTVAKAR